MSPRHRALHTTIGHPGCDVTRFGFNPRQYHAHRQRAAHARPDRVRCSLREDRRVHTCGPEPAGGLL
jgi:hypothetical protein